MDTEAKRVVYVLIAYDAYGDSESVISVLDNEEWARKALRKAEAKYRSWGTWDARLEEYTLNELRD